METTREDQLRADLADLRAKHQRLVRLVYVRLHQLLAVVILALTACALLAPQTPEDGSLAGYLGGPGGVEGRAAPHGAEWILLALYAGLLGVALIHAVAQVALGWDAAGRRARRTASATAAMLVLGGVYGLMVFAIGLFNRDDPDFTITAWTFVMAGSLMSIPAAGFAGVALARRRESLDLLI